jgi:hypothetical protein
LSPRSTKARARVSNERETRSTSGKRVKKEKVITTNGFLWERSAK